MKPTYVTEPFLPPLDRFVEYLEEIWKNKYLTNDGPFVRRLEESLAVLFGVRHVLCVNNGTLALQLAIRALGFRNQVITTPFTFVASSSALVWEGCEPVFVDIDPETLNLDPEKIESAITDKTSGILPVHVYGNPCAVERIEAVAMKHDLKVLYDAAQAFGTRVNGESVLKWGDASTLSLHATKIFQTAEGGAILTNSDTVAEEIKRSRNFGYEAGMIKGLGINAKMNELSGALGVLNLEYYEDGRASRRSIFDLYYDSLTGLDALRFIELRGEHNYSYFPVILEDEAARTRVTEFLNDKQIFPRAYFDPSMETLFGSQEDVGCPIALEMCRRILCLPIFADLKVERVTEICELLKAAL